MKLRNAAIISMISLCGWSVAAYALEIRDVTFQTESAGKVIFRHFSHMKKKSRTAPNISCKACHNENLQKRTRYSMAQMKQGKSCGQCHNGKKAFGLARCSACHKIKDITIQVKSTGPVKFRHSTHLKKTSNCGTCHNSIFKTSGNAPVSMAGMVKGTSCGACHNGKKAFSLASCTTCHPVKERTFRVKGSGNVIFSHTSHLTIYKCGDCHTAIFEPATSKARRTMADMEAGKSCGACHDGNSAFSVKENCATCHKM